MDTKNLNKVMQSAYKQFHSTETALIRVQNDIIVNMDKKRGVIIVNLDLSTAFDTSDHTMLLNVLQHRLGISGTALNWFKSHLCGRTQSVSIECEHSTPVPYVTEYLKDQCLGHYLYIIYTLPLGDIHRNAAVSYHLYADDTQIYLSFDFENSASQQETQDKMQQCVSRDYDLDDV